MSHDPPQGQPQQRPDELGPILRLEGVDYDRLPAQNAGRDALRPLLEGTLSEALRFVHSVDEYDGRRGSKGSGSGWYSKGSVKYRGEGNIGGPGEVVVELLERSLPKKDVIKAISVQTPGAATPWRRSTKPVSETWVCRRSVHSDERAGGTGTWQEFADLMKVEHVETERDMTPTVVNAQKTQTWPAAKLVEAITMPDLVPGPKVWSSFTLDIVEMEHDLKTLGADNRVFPVLQMTCLSEGGSGGEAPEMLVISVPINEWKTVRTPDAGAGAPKKVIEGRSDFTIGSYVSIERFRKVPNKGNGSNVPNNNSQIEWVMATASHARGWIPLFMQKPFIPKKVAIDVPLFLKFMSGRRSAAPKAQNGGGAPNAAEPQAQ